MLTKARAARPGEVPLFMAFDNDGPVTTVTTGPRPEAPVAEMHLQLVGRPERKPSRGVQMVVESEVELYRAASPSPRRT